jgi:hypothetical protein
MKNGDLRTIGNLKILVRKKRNSMNKNVIKNENTSTEFSSETIHKKLENYPHILWDIVTMTDTEISTYIMNILKDTREHTRTGFPEETALFLLSWYNHLNPKAPVLMSDYRYW